MRVRDLLPVERISLSRLRTALDARGDDDPLVDWSRRGAGAIRPTRLAELIRQRIWEANDFSLAAVRAAALASQTGAVSNEVEIEVQTDEGWLALTCRTQFRSGSGGRVAAEVQIAAGQEWISLTASPVLLRPPENPMPAPATP